MAKARRQIFDASELMQGLDRLAASKESVARSMGVAMGQAVRDEAKMRVPVGDRFDGALTPGLLRDSIYLAYDERRNVLNPNRYRYVVSWNSKRAPHGHLVEFGHWMPYLYATDHAGNFWTPKPLQDNPHGSPYWVAAEPFLGPAFDAKLPSLMGIGSDAARSKFTEAIHGH